MIKSITVKNIRGIDSKTLNIDLHPNKPALLIASNGFGKSSLAKAFDAMNRERIKLDDNDYHKGDTTALPVLEILWENDSNSMNLVANSESNTISTYFDHYVISSNMHAKGVGRNFGGRTQVSASIVADPIILFDSVPERKTCPYSFGAAKQQLSWLSKAVVNLSDFLSNEVFCQRIIENDIIKVIKATGQERQKSALFLIRSRLEGPLAAMSRDQALDYIEKNELSSLENITHISTLSKFFKHFHKAPTPSKTAWSFICAIQIAELFQENYKELRLYCERKSFECEKTRLITLFSNFNSSWQAFIPKETDGKLVIEFPKLHFISNGQRDSLNFIASLEKARRKLKKLNSILVIDEVFDYMDEANIVSAQYYISKMIDQYKDEGRNIYPIILTHLAAELFGGYIFGNKKRIQVKYLKETNCVVSFSMKKILKERSNKSSSLKEPIENQLLHFNPSTVNLRTEFQHAGLKETWGDPGVFRNYIQMEMTKYLSDSSTEIFDPAAVCCALRVKIEELVFLQIESDINRTRFTDEFVSGTNDKLEFCESIGITIPEHYYLLGIIYNESLHWRDDDGFERKIVARLMNLSIRYMIGKVFS